MVRALVFSLVVVGMPGIVPGQEAAAGAHLNNVSATLSGYVSSGYHFGSGGNGAAFALAPSSRNGSIFDVFGISLRKPVQDWLFDAGYRIDLWIGPDAKHLDTAATDHTAMLRQAYLDLRIPLADPRESGELRSLDLRIGAFDSPLGYESLDRPLNPHYTHSWGFTIEPTAHTGVMGMYPGVDALENGESNYLFSLGVANTVDPLINGTTGDADRQTLLSGLTWRLPESLGPLSGSTFAAGYVNGQPVDGGATVQNLYLALGLPVPQDRWRAGLVYDTRMLNGDANDDAVYGAYLSRRLNAKTWLNLRGEIFHDGARLFSGESAAEQSSGHSLATTLDYQLWENVISRLEYRWDHFDTRVNGRHNAQAFHLNLIYEF